MTDTVATAYPHLLEPLDLGFVTCPTGYSWVRCTGLEEAENGFERMAAFTPSGPRAAGPIVTGGIAPNEQARPWQMARP